MFCGAGDNTGGGIGWGWVGGDGWVERQGKGGFDTEGEGVKGGAGGCVWPGHLW